jgi:F-type H+-transporting ATPase subunit delta
MSIETIARRYGSALADVVLKTGETETVKSELTQWEVMINSNAELLDAFGNPSVVHIIKENVLERLLERSQPSRTTANFLRILLRNGRLTDLSEINAKFLSVLDERSGILKAQITSARDLPDAERSELKANLEKLTGKQVNLDFDINEELIGGVVTRIGSTVYDSSVKTQLDNLKQQLVNG